MIFATTATVAGGGPNGGGRQKQLATGRNNRPETGAQRVHLSAPGGLVQVASSPAS